MPLFRHLFPRSALILALLVLGSVSLPSLALESDYLAPWVGTMLNGTKCDGGQVNFGPYDYLQRDHLKAQLEIVEARHFTPNIESLQSGNTTSAMGDLGYTLKAWPNHHRALNSALRFRLQHKELWHSDDTALGYPAECYLQRAMNFSPNDPIPYMLYGLLMHQMGQYTTALEAYRQALLLQPKDMITQYNMGLALVELKKYAEARQVAQKVYASGFPLPGLKRKLIAAGQWKADAKAADNTPDVDVSKVLRSETKSSQAAVPDAIVSVAPAEKTVSETDNIVEDIPAASTQSNVTTSEAATPEVSVLPEAVPDDETTDSTSP